MQNIAILVKRLYAGGAERIAGLLSKYLSRRYKVYVFVVETDNIIYDFGGQLIDVSVNGKGKIEDTIREYKKKYKIDCAISFLVLMNVMNIRTRVGECVILSERGSLTELVSRPSNVTGIMERWYGSADKIISVAYGVEYDLIQNYAIEPALITTIYNFIDKRGILDKARMCVEDEICAFVGSSRLILNVGRLEEQKNQKKLLVQFSRLLSMGHDVKLMIVGTGSCEAQLRELVRELGITQRVKFVKYCANPFPYYRIASMMVLSSDAEGLPNVVLESMLLGLPVVAVDCLSGPRELLKNSRDYSTRTKGVEICQNGVLVERCGSDETGETDYLAQAMELLLKDESLRCSLAENAREFMKAYSNEGIERQWIDVIENTRPMERPFPAVSIPELEKFRKVIVYGAGDYGIYVMKHILENRPELDLLCFAVSDKSKNEPFVLDLPVYEITELEEHKADAIVLVGVLYPFEDEVKHTLDRLGFRHALAVV